MPRESLVGPARHGRHRHIRLEGLLDTLTLERGGETRRVLRDGLGLHGRRGWCLGSCWEKPSGKGGGGGGAYNLVDIEDDDLVDTRIDVIALSERWSV